MKSSICKKTLVTLLALPMLCAELAPAFSKNYIFRTSNTPARVQALGVDTVNAVITVGNQRHYGLFIVNNPKDSALGSDMSLQSGQVLLTVDGYSVTSARQADNWLAHRPHKPMIFTYAIIVNGVPKILSKEIASKATLNPGASESSSPISSKPGPMEKQFSTSELESECVSMINESRRKAGLAPVQQDSQLAGLARKYADYMGQHKEGYEITVGRSPHTDLQGRSPQERAHEYGVSRAVSENIGRASRGPFEPDIRQLRNLHKSMMDEGPGGGHYETIMNPNARSVGVGICRIPGRFYLTEEFSN